MRATLSSIALCATGASAVALGAGTNIEARQTSLATWYLVGFQPECNIVCFANYAIYGKETTIGGVTFPAFAARCETYGGCQNLMAGSEVDSSVYTEAGKLTITQKVTVNGKTKTATGTVPWNEMTLAYFEVPVTSVS
ncbi:hypothetical protein HD806DRAFT_489554 [Xylariaceae sp. AK1471]|nr:hypothetical protein HD806DRAFT_489554 [Xylariaceae sp. AK1471]